MEANIGNNNIIRFESTLEDSKCEKLANASTRGSFSSQHESNLFNYQSHKRIKLDQHGRDNTSSVPIVAGSSSQDQSQEDTYIRKRRCISNIDFDLIDNLPETLFVEILRYLPLLDKLNLCTAYKDTTYFFAQKTLTRYINLQGWYNVNLNLRLFKSLNPEYVTFLNLNDCHWLGRDVLLDYIGKCVNLKTLLALGTQLRLSDEDLIAYNKTKINKLALTMDADSDDRDIARKGILERVNSLGLEICYRFWDERRLFEVLSSMFPTLQKLWMEIPNTIKSLGLATFASNANLHLYYCNRKLGEEHVVACFENLKEDCCKPPRNSLLAHEFQLFENHGFDPIYNRKVARVLYLGEGTLDSIFFEELNFKHKSGHRCESEAQTHNETLHAAFNKILNSPNARKIKKLAFCTCLFESVERILPSSFWNDLKEITHLELYSCQNSYPCTFEEYHMIANLTKLRSLFLEPPSKLDGTYFIDILKGCSQLETLSIKSFWANPRLQRSVQKALEYSTSLKEFTFEIAGLIIIDDLLTALIRLKHIKLRKLHLKFILPHKSCWFSGDEDDYDSDKDDYDSDKDDHGSHCFSFDILSRYFQNNPQLTHCLFTINCLGHEYVEYIKQAVSKFNMTNTFFQVTSNWRDMKELSTVCSDTLREDFGTF